MRRFFLALVVAVLVPGYALAVDFDPTSFGVNGNVCSCAGTIGLNVIDQTAMQAVATSQFQEQAFAQTCVANGGFHTDYTCSNWKAVVDLPSPTCGAAGAKAQLVAAYGIPTALVDSYLVFNATCSFGAPPAATTIAGGSAQGSSNNDCDPGTNVAKGTICLKDPLKNSKFKITSVPVLIGVIVKALLGVIGAVTLLMIVVGGFRWLVSAGNAEQIQSGTKTMLWAVIGLFLVFASYILLNTFINYLTTGQSV